MNRFCWCVVLLLGSASSSAATIERVIDGSFEGDSSAWTFTGAFRCSDAICTLPAAAGSFYGSNGFGFEQVPAIVSSYSLGSFQQSVPVPEGPATLEFSVRRVASGDAVSTYLWITLDGTLLRQVDTELVGFERISIGVPENFIGFGSRVLRFETICANEAPFPLDCDRFDVDDVSLVTPEPEAASLGILATAALWALGRRRAVPRSALPCQPGPAGAPRGWPKAGVARREFTVPVVPAGSH